MIIGLDLSNTHVGLGAIPGPIGGPRAVRAPLALELAHFAAHGSDDVERTAGRVLDLVGDWCDRHPSGRTADGQLDCDVVIERPPLSGKVDGEHGSQAQVGFTLGQLVGGVRVPLARMGARVRLVDVGTWRDRMIAASNAWGVPAVYPQNGFVEPTLLGGPRVERVDLVREEDGRLFVQWKGCGHRRAIAIGELSRFAYVRCPTCEIERAYPRRRADRIRDGWKQLACVLTEAHAPAPYAVVVADARSRAKNKQQPDWTLSGVNDACEAFWVACSALETGS